jgi:magnesium transporter
MDARMTPPLDEPITRHLHADFARLEEGQTVESGLRVLRQRPIEGRIVYFYVVDEAGRLKGVVPTRRLLLSDPATRVADIMLTRVIAIPDSATVLDACEFFTLHRLLAFPVVDDEKRMLGVVDVDLYTESLTDLERREGNADVFQLIGVHLTVAQQSHPMVSFRRRFPWLLCNIAGGILAALLSGIYQVELAWGDAVLALFIPVVLALAESVAIQSVTLSLQWLHAQPPSWRSLMTALRHEGTTGLLLGAACAVILACVALVWLGKLGVVMCLLGGIAGGVTVAAIFGQAVPGVLRLFHLDPQVAAGPIALALADMATLLLYFNLARVVLV